MLQELERLILYLSGDIEYGGMNLSESFHRMAEGSIYFRQFFEQLSEDIQNKKGFPLWKLWQSRLAGSRAKELLKEDDLRILLELGSDLGRTDRQTQMNALRVYRQRVLKRLEQEEAEYAPIARVYRIVGAAVGIFLVILLV